MSITKTIKILIAMLFINALPFQAEAAKVSYSISRGQGQDGNLYTLKVTGDLIHSVHVQLPSIIGWSVSDEGVKPDWIGSLSTPAASEQSLNWFSFDNINTDTPINGFHFQSPDALINFIPQMKVFVDYAETEDTWVPITQTPLPGALLLFLSTIPGLMFAGKRKLKN